MDLRVAGKYKIIKKIGSGAFGEIYQGIFDYIILSIILIINFIRSKFQDR